MAHPVSLIADISFWQRTMNWSAFVAGGGQGAILRASFGPYHDSCVDTFWRTGRAAGVPLGVYLFFLAGYDIQKTVDNLEPFLELQSGQRVFPGELGVWVDCEEHTRPADMAKDRCTKLLETCLYKVYEKTGAYPGVYTRANWWVTNMVYSDLISLRNVKLWVAHYTFNPETRPTIPAVQWPRGHFLHQYTDRGPGQALGVLSKQIDLNAFYGTLGMYQSWIKRELPVNPAVPETVVVTVNGLAIRTYPVITASTLIRRVNKGTLLHPTEVVFADDGRPWYKLDGCSFVASWFTAPC